VISEIYINITIFISRKKKTIGKQILKLIIASQLSFIFGEISQSFGFYDDTSLDKKKILASYSLNFVELTRKILLKKLRGFVLIWLKIPKCTWSNLDTNYQLKLCWFQNNIDFIELVKAFESNPTNSNTIYYYFSKHFKLRFDISKQRGFLINQITR
jgi:hypothetical protein